MSSNKPILSLLPFAVFLLLYLGTGITLEMQGEADAFYQFPPAAAALLAIAPALAVYWRDLEGVIQTFLRGMAESTVIIMCLIFLLAGAFSAVTKAMGGVESTVNLGLTLLPSHWLLPGFFLIACCVSLAIGTSMGTIGTVAPIALGVAAKAGLPIPLTMGVVVGGAMFGDNLSAISDTTIAATMTQGAAMKDKMRVNFRFALPAAAIVVALLLLNAEPAAAVGDKPFSLIKTLPYAVVLALSVAGVNVVLVLLTGILFAGLVGFATGSLGFLQFGKAIYDGFLSMADIYFLSSIVAGLASVATQYGGLNYLLSGVLKLVRSKRSAETALAVMVSVADLCIANNVIAILVTGKLSKELSERFAITPARAANLLDIYSCFWQGILPYGAQLLLAGSLAHISPVQIMPHVWYVFVLGLITTLTIALGRGAGTR